MQTVAASLQEGENQIKGAAITLSKTDGGFSMDRIFVPPEQRGKGIMAKAIQDIVWKARKDCVNLSVSVAPDIDDAYLTDKMVAIFMQNGFSPYECDGEVYRKELILDVEKQRVVSDSTINENDERNLSVTSPSVYIVLNKLATYPFADKIIVFGSLAKNANKAGDVDIFLNAEPDDPQKEMYLSLLISLAKKYYGNLDPFFVESGVLFSRNDYATGWQVAKKEQSLLRAIHGEGKTLREVMVSYGINPNGYRDMKSPELNNFEM
jgi:hypothetical protein